MGSVGSDGVVGRVGVASLSASGLGGATRLSTDTESLLTLLPIKQTSIMSMSFLMPLSGCGVRRVFSSHRYAQPSIFGKTLLLMQKFAGR
jgi:hypothetical protein